jgi:hypothetical protein
MLILLLSLFFAAPALSQEKFIRLDQPGFDELNLKEQSLVILLSRGCSACQSQLEALASCDFKAKHTYVLMSGGSEELLQKEVRRKKIPYPSYLLTDAFKQTYHPTGATPALLWFNHDKVEKLIGVQTCEQIKTKFPL